MTFLLFHSGTAITALMPWAMTLTPLRKRSSACASEVSTDTRLSMTVLAMVRLIDISSCVSPR